MCICVCLCLCIYIYLYMHIHPLAAVQIKVQHTAADRGGGDSPTAASVRARAVLRPRPQSSLSPATAASSAPLRAPTSSMRRSSPSPTPGEFGYRAPHIKLDTNPPAARAASPHQRLGALAPPPPPPSLSTRMPTDALGAGLDALPIPALPPATAAGKLRLGATGRATVKEEWGKRAGEPELAGGIGAELGGLGWG
jgi:hypothetical protein